jgi:cytochrome c oxidase subunit 2
MALAAGSGNALAGMGQPSPRQMGMQDPASEVAQSIFRFHDMTNLIIITITIFVFILLTIVILRFNERSNPTPSRTTHHTMLEVVWTVVPILILVAIAVPSFKLLYLQYSYPKPDLTVKAIGNAWFWEHEYPDQGNVRVTSNMLKDEDVLATKHGKAYLKKFDKMDELAKLRAMYDEAKPLWDEQKLVRQLSVDNEIAVPVGKVVHLLVTSNDVIHAWTIPSFGSKTQAVPGRITSTWFRADKVGVYYGQCSVLCGKQHSGMPIAVRVVQQAAFDQWLAAAKAKDWKKARAILVAATDDAGGTKVATAGSAPQK